MKDKRASDFLRAADLDWRNAIFIDCIFCTKVKNGCGGYLMIPDADAKPVLIQTRELTRSLGYRIETKDCNGRLLKSQLEKLYAKYFIWSVDDCNACPLQWLSESDACYEM